MLIICGQGLEIFSLIKPRISSQWCQLWGATVAAHFPGILADFMCAWVVCKAYYRKWVCLWQAIVCEWWNQIYHKVPDSLMKELQKVVWLGLKHQRLGDVERTLFKMDYTEQIDLHHDPQGDYVHASNLQLCLSILQHHNDPPFLTGHYVMDDGTPLQHPNSRGDWLHSGCSYPGMADLGSVPPWRQARQWCWWELYPRSNLTSSLIIIQSSVTSLGIHFHMYGNQYGQADEARRVGVEPNWPLPLRGMKLQLMMMTTGEQGTYITAGFINLIMKWQRAARKVRSPVSCVCMYLLLCR